MPVTPLLRSCSSFKRAWNGPGVAQAAHRLAVRLVLHAGVGETDHRRAEHHVPTLALAHPADVALDVLVTVTDERVLGLVVVIVRVDEHVLHGTLLL